MNTIQFAREVFNSYCAMDAPETPDDMSSALQVRLFRWQTRNFGGANLFQLLAGATEEIGELAHAVLKNSQKIRGLEDQEKFRESAGDAIADCMVYLIQICTHLRLDWYTLLHETANKVMERNWVADPDKGGTND